MTALTVLHRDGGTSTLRTLIRALDIHGSRSGRALAPVSARFARCALRLLALLLLAGCTGLPPAQAAAAWTAVALTASAVERATGGCYAECGAGTVCNPVNGLCEVLPCRGACTEEERCDESGLVAKCVSKKGEDIVIETEQEVEPPEDSQKSE